MPYRRNVVFPRIIAVIVDSIIYGFLISLTQIIFLPFQLFDDNISEVSLQATSESLITAPSTVLEPSEIVISVVIALIIGLILFVYIPFQKDGKTAGKILMNIKAIDANGDNPSLFQHFLRAILLYGQYLYVLALILLFIDPLAFEWSEYIINIGVTIIVLSSLIMVVSTPEARGIHDFIANTYVVDQDYDPRNDEEPKSKNPQNWAFKETEEEDDFLSQYDKNNVWDR